MQTGRLPLGVPEEISWVAVAADTLYVVDVFIAFIPWFEERQAQSQMEPEDDAAEAATVVLTKPVSECYLWLYQCCMDAVGDSRAESDPEPVKVCVRTAPGHWHWQPASAEDSEETTVPVTPSQAALIVPVEPTQTHCGVLLQVVIDLLSLKLGFQEGQPPASGRRRARQRPGSRRRGASIKIGFMPSQCHWHWPRLGLGGAAVAAAGPAPSRPRPGPGPSGCRRRSP